MTTSEEHRLYTLDELLQIKRNDTTQVAYLKAFAAKCSETDHISVTEYTDYYEIIVSHRHSATSSGGAECYHLNKENGHTEMIWHEYPQRIPGFENMTEDSAEIKKE
jgi:hypothetical protein